MSLNTIMLLSIVDEGVKYKHIIHMLCIWICYVFPGVTPTPYYYTHSRSESRRTGQHNSLQDAVFLQIHGRSWAEVLVGKALGLSCEASGSNLQEAYSSSRSPDSPLIEWTLDEVPVNLLFQKDKVSVERYFTLEIN